MTENVLDTEMDVKVEEIELLTKKINITLHKKIVLAKEEEIYADLRKAVEVPGFRKGKAPLTILRKRFAKDVEKEMMNSLVPEYGDKAMAKEDLIPATTPKIDDVEYKEGISLDFSITCEVLPKVDIKGYSDMDLDVPVEEVTDENITETLENVRRNHIKLVSKEGDAVVIDKDDNAVIDLKTFIDDEEVKDVFLTYADYNIKVGSNRFVPEIEDVLLGKSKGNTFDVQFEIPEKYNKKEYVGKTVKVEIVVKDIQVEVLPELDDDFAKLLIGEGKTMDEVRAEIRKELPNSFEEARNMKRKTLLKETLLKENSFDVPPALLKQYLNRHIYMEHVKLVREGRDWDRLMFDVLNPDGEADRKAREDAAHFILINMIVEKEDIAPSEEEIKEAIVEYGMWKGAGFENGMPKLSDEEMERVRFNLMEDKVISFLMKDEGTAEGNIIDVEQVASEE